MGHQHHDRKKYSKRINNSTLTRTKQPKSEGGKTTFVMKKIKSNACRWPTTKQKYTKSKWRKHQRLYLKNKKIKTRGRKPSDTGEISDDKPTTTMNEQGGCDKARIEESQWRSLQPMPRRDHARPMGRHLKEAKAPRTKRRQSSHEHSTSTAAIFDSPLDERSQKKPLLTPVLPSPFVILTIPS